MSDITSFPEILGGRVKTLHPNVCLFFIFIIFICIFVFVFVFSFVFLFCQCYLSHFFFLYYF